MADSSKYNWYVGTAPSNVFSGAAVVTSAAGDSTPELAGLGLAEDTDHWLGVRAVSAAGVEETNTSCICRVRIESGALVGSPPNPVLSATVQPAAAGAVDLTFSYSAESEPGAAVGLQVAEIVGGSGDWDNVLETVDFTGTVIHRKATLETTWSDGDRVALAVRAVTTDSVGGPERACNVITADATAPDTPESLAAAQES